MNWELALVIAGTTVQLFGVTVTIRGAREVWRDVATPDDRFLSPLITAYRRTRSALAAARRRASRSVPPTQTIRPSGIPSGESFGVPTMLPGLPPQPSTLTGDAAIRELDQRIRDLEQQLISRIGKVDHHLSMSIDTARVGSVTAAAKATEQAERERRRTVRGLRTEAYGFLFLTVGTLIQTAGTFAGMAS